MDVNGCEYTDDSVNKRFTHITDNNFSLTAPIYIEGVKMFGKIDTGSELTVLNISSFYKKLKLNKMNNVSDNFKIFWAVITVVRDWVKLIL
jgi:hypothetical protein